MDLRKHQLALMTDPAYHKADTFLERSDMLIKAGVNPFATRKLLTRAQSEGLGETLARLREAHGDDMKTIHTRFMAEGAAYLRQTTDATTVDTALAEFDEDRTAFYDTHRRLKFLPQGASDEERLSYQPPAQRFSRTNAVQAKGALRDLHAVFDRFLNRHQLSHAMVAHACIGSRTHEPLKATSITTAVSVLAGGKSVPAPFRYMAEHPDAFFTELEAALGQRDQAPHPISAQERTELCDAVIAANTEWKMGAAR